MIKKIRVSDLSVTLLALAALIFLLPPDKDTKTDQHGSQTSISNPSHSNTADQQSVRGNLIRAV